MKGAILRVWAKWYSESEKSSKYFFGLEKRNAKNKNMSATYENGVITRNQGKILRIQKDYYEKLYTSNPDFQCQIRGEPEKVISEELKELIDAPVSMQEIQLVIKSTVKNKSPGLSGLSVEFYIVFWNHLKDIYFEAINYAFLQGVLHQSARYGIISLIPKPDRNLLYVKNWRPIILLNLDFKILSKVIANKIKLTLNDIIHPDQAAFVKGRNLADNVRKIFDMLKIADEDNLPGIFVSIDFQKAFDMVEYKCVDEALRWFHFGPVIRQWVKLLFESFYQQTYSNGYFSEEITTSKGLFQGNPVAPYFFIIVMEILAIKLRRNKDIKGLKVGEQELLLAIFTDDLGLMLKGEKSVF